MVVFKKNRVCTTISAKHWGLLKKHSEKYLTQQKVLEVALESLERSSKQDSALFPEDLYESNICRQIMQMRSSCIVHKDILMALINTADFELIREVFNVQKPTEYLITSYYQKPLKKCSLKEVMDGLIFFCKISNIADTISYTDEGGHYILRLVHSLNVNSSKIFKIFITSLLDAYEIRTECEISEKSLLMKIYKDF